MQRLFFSNELCYDGNENIEFKGDARQMLHNAIRNLLNL